MRSIDDYDDTGVQPNVSFVLYWDIAMQHDKELHKWLYAANNQNNKVENWMQNKFCEEEGVAESELAPGGSCFAKFNRSRFSTQGLEIDQKPNPTKTFLHIGDRSFSCTVITKFAFAIFKFFQLIIFQDQNSEYLHCTPSCKSHKFTERLLTWIVAYGHDKPQALAKFVSTIRAKQNLDNSNQHIVCAIKGQSHKYPSSLCSTSPSTFAQHLSTQHLDDLEVLRLFVLSSPLTIHLSVHINFIFIHIHKQSIYLFTYLQCK